MKMKAMRASSLSFSILVLSGSYGLPLRAAMTTHKEQKTETPLSQAKYVPHGGMGVISDSIYIVVQSDKNELLLPKGQRWIGSSRSTMQRVCISGNTVYEDAARWGQLPLDRTIMVSFEGDRIYFFDFKNVRGGFYERE